ncbi:MAG: hypothetical protein Unbinned3205contig1001_20 [Prokaryotic dsDNA virus sp.]|nr:MAG: hypothetical protein Unbinned3205contig1001_20 [Prokaryotic dsDNA virus sp.]|tara:strand:- start:1196 stop:1516 length:321 start_codon:yes stop_codon:yes gene_type:complete
MKIKKHEKIIKDFLTAKPHLRDNDMKLLASVWWQEIRSKGLDLHSYSAHETLELLANGKLSNPSSIRRCRAKLQELHPELRGNRYKDRQKNQRSEVATEIKHWNNK